MSLADDLLKLEAMKNAGSLTDAEFDDAKRLLLRDARLRADTPVEQRDAITSAVSDVAGSDPTLGLAVNRYVDLKTKEYNSGKIVTLFAVLFAAIVAIIICAGYSSATDGNTSFPTGFCTFRNPADAGC